jgi:uncharacterized protein with HEPN domain
MTRDDDFVHYDILWQTVQEDLPALVAALAAVPPPPAPEPES